MTKPGGLPAHRRSSAVAARPRPQLGPRSFPKRVAALSVPARQVHRLILQAFLENGCPPGLADLRSGARAAGASFQRLLTELVVHDVIQRTSDGTIQVAYPFSATPTLHQVQIQGGPTVFAMCVIDALGLPFMVSRSATIFTEDPFDATPISIAVGCGRSGKPTLSEVHWHPETAVVLVNRPPQEPVIQAECTCPYLNGFASRETAQLWRAAHADLDVLMLTQKQAAREARNIFGRVLNLTLVSP